jgi:hypothetical protein
MWALPNRVTHHECSGPFFNRPGRGEAAFGHVGSRFNGKVNGKLGGPLRGDPFTYGFPVPLNR